MVAQVLMDHDDTPVEDKIIVLRGASWADYQRLLEMRGDPRVSGRIAGEIAARRSAARR